MSPRHQTDVVVTNNNRVSMPVAMLLLLLTTVACGYAAWASTSTTVAAHGVKINELEVDQRTTREILIRVDERTKRMDDFIKKNP